MKHLSVSFFSTVTKDSPLPEISKTLDKIPPHTLDHAPWFRNPGTPEVLFSMGHSADSIFLKYYVTERDIRAVHTRPNDPVYKDSCVEIFISFEGDERYYNFEFNFLGNVLAEFGPDRGNRTLLPATLIRKIKTQAVITSLQEEEEGMVHWELTVVIPFEVFLHHTITSLKEKVGRVNFHKCGDDLQEPHFLTWSNIQSESPDFHLPQFFGKLKFERDEVRL